MFEGINSLDEGWDSNTLAKELQKYSNIDSVLIRCLKLDSKKLANRYLEAFVYSSYNEGTNKKADNEIRNNFRLPQMSMKEVVSEISGCGRYIINRYEREHRDDLNLNITIPPIIDLEDRENSKFGETLNYLNDTDDITVGKLFEYNIMIPVIQRDYCMGARITGENDFLAFLLNGFNKSDKIKASTVLLSVALEENEKTIYIFDGQQRTFTLYNILKYCGESDLKQYKFVGRDINNENEYGSPYSKESVEQLYKVLKNNKIDKKGFAEYIKNNVSLKVKTVDSISGAEQFFMDINGGVKLNKYEIYKALLSNQLSQIGRDDIVRKIENKWLQYFYNFRIEYLQSSNIKSDESDKEEIMEIRFIEYVCRFVYRKNHHGLTYSDIWTDGSNGIYKSNDVSYGNRADKTESELLMFDEIESKSEIVTKLDYVSRLDKDDIVEIETIMDYIVGLKITSGDLELVKSTEVGCYLNSTGNKLCFIQLHIESDKKNVLKSSCEYVKRFIWSLDDENRKSIRHYYKYKNISKLRRIYDEDEIIRDIILNKIDKNIIKGKWFPYSICWKNSIINIFGGYHNEKKSLEYRYDKEIPVYYWKDVVKYKDKILRQAFLYEKFGTESENLNLALVENGIKYEDEGYTNIERIEKKIEYKDFRFKFEKDEYWQDFTTRSAYIFRYDAYKVLEKRIVKPK